MQATTAREDLKSKTARWSAAMRSADTGPLVIASEVVDVVDAWDQHKTDAGNITADAWLTDKVFRPGLGVAFWRMRDAAIRALDTGDRSVLRALHHETAVWIHRSVPKDQQPDLLWRCFKKSRQQKGAAVSKAQAVRVLRSITGSKPTPKSCGECDRLRALLISHGVNPG